MTEKEQSDCWTKEEFTDGTYVRLEITIPKGINEKCEKINHPAE